MIAEIPDVTIEAVANATRSAREDYVDRIGRLPAGHSFFVPDVEAHALEFVRKACMRRGIEVKIRNMPYDPVHGQRGARVWREEDLV